MKIRTRRVRPHLVCPECGEPARKCPPRRWVAATSPRPRWSHPDGEPLCPVPGPIGASPAAPCTAPIRRITRRYAVMGGASTAPVTASPEAAPTEPVYVVGTDDALTVFDDREAADRMVATMAGRNFPPRVLPLSAGNWDEIRAIMGTHHQPHIAITDMRAKRNDGTR